MAAIMCPDPLSATGFRVSGEGTKRHANAAFADEHHGPAVGRRASVARPAEKRDSRMTSRKEFAPARPVRRTFALLVATAACALLAISSLHAQQPAQAPAPAPAP